MKYLDVPLQHFGDTNDWKEECKEVKETTKKFGGAAQEGTSESDKPLVAPGTKAEKKAGDDDAKAASDSSSAAREVGPGATDVEMTAAGAIASKRAREASDSTGNVGTSGTGEPPKKDSDWSAAYLETKAKPAA
ncbi:hypothetical protein HPB52_024821 [Rhipicephalus sanguineus]|uniref:Uncharacterized protein n=1 Tax=Rhipicephalus sanguineus TaxID=34632 RepID=A0A9D4PAS9_RHISA|nr:hypothetical protein HPB52_024821 [Rhipicephalus sanguineus]